MGQINKELKGLEHEDATAEMDRHAESIMRDELGETGRRLEIMSPEEFANFFGRRDRGRRGKVTARRFCDKEIAGRWHLMLWR